MNTAPSSTAGTLEQRKRALLELVEADRMRRCAQILGDEQARAAALQRQAHADARARMRQAFDEQRRHLHERIAAAQARLATERRLHAQQRTAALLRLAWQQLPGALLASWQQREGRARWVAQVLAAARTRLHSTAWRVVHASGWSAAEQAELARTAQSAAGAAVVFEADPGIAAGLKVVANRNVIDGSLAGLLADRTAVEAELLRRLELAP